MKQTQNQFYGKTSEMTPSTDGATFLNQDTGKLHFAKGGSFKETSSDVNVTSSQNDQNSGIKIVATKESTGGGWLSKINGLLAYTNSNGVGGPAHSITGIKDYVTHTGGQIAFVNGHYQEVWEAGTGDISAFYGSYDKMVSDGVDAHTIDWYIGQTIGIFQRNPNLTVGKMGAQNTQLHFEAATTVTSECYVALLDIDMEVPQADVTVTGDFSFLWVKPHTATGYPTVTGAARALHIESTLPSNFAGSITAAGLIDTAVTEHTDNAAAVAAGLAVGTHYRTGDDLKIVH
mgnify:CR=1 FL=1